MTNHTQATPGTLIAHEIRSALQSILRAIERTPTGQCGYEGCICGSDSCICDPTVIGGDGCYGCTFVPTPTPTEYEHPRMISVIRSSLPTPTEYTPTPTGDPEYPRWNHKNTVAYALAYGVPRDDTPTGDRLNRGTKMYPRVYDSSGTCTGHSTEITYDTMGVRECDRVPFTVTSDPSEGNPHFYDCPGDTVTRQGDWSTHDR